MPSNNKYAILRSQRMFLRLLAANTVSRFGDSLDMIAYSLMMYEVTGSASLMAVLVALNALPTVLLQPLAGVWADRCGRLQRIMALCDVGRGAAVLLTALLYGAGRLTPWMLAATTLAISSLEALRIPAGVALRPLLLDEDKYTLGAGLAGALERTAEVVGLCLAGGAVALLGTPGVLAIDAATFLFSACVVARLRPCRARTPHAAEGGLRMQLLEGVRYAVRGDRFVLLLLLAGALMNFALVPMSALGTPYVVDVLGAGAGALSAMELLISAGMALGALAMPKLCLGGRRMFFGSLAFLGACLLLLGAAPLLEPAPARLAAALGVFGLTGVGFGVLTTLYSAAFMRCIERDVIGRMSGLTNAVLNAATPLGALLCAAVAGVLPIAAVIAASGALLLAITAVLSRVRGYARFDEVTAALAAPSQEEVLS